MLHPLIKKVAKLLGLLLITSNLILYSNLSYSQIKYRFSDSLLLKQELDSVLAKHGLKSKGFVITVISLNQKGGQTAYSITNNYYGDTLKNEANFGIDTFTEGGKKWVTVYPKKGVWQSPFIGLDSVKIHDCSYDPGSGSIAFISGLYITFKGERIQHSLELIIRQGVCSKNMPMKVGILKKDAFFTFGDYADDDKFYLYRNGKVVLVPKVKK